MSDLLNFESGKEEVVNLLKQITNEDKTKNLFDHLQQLFDTKLVLQNDEKFLDLFEDISYRIRNEGFYIFAALKNAVRQTHVQQTQKT